MRFWYQSFETTLFARLTTECFFSTADKHPNCWSETPWRLDDVNTKLHRSHSIKLLCCSGDESCIKNCSHEDWRSHDCVHSQDAGVICGKLLPWWMNTNIIMLCSTLTVPSQGKSQHGFVIQVVVLQSLFVGLSEYYILLTKVPFHSHGLT